MGVQAEGTDMNWGLSSFTSSTYRNKSLLKKCLSHEVIISGNGREERTRKISLINMRKFIFEFDCMTSETVESKTVKLLI